MIAVLIQMLAVCSVLFVQCGGKKAKKASPKTTVKPKRGGKTAKTAAEFPVTATSTSSVKPSSQEPATAPEPTPSKPPSPPKPEVQDTKVAQMMPESEREDEMKGGIKLPPAKNLKCEADMEAAAAAPPKEQQKSTAPASSAENGDAKEGKKEEEELV